MNSLYLQYILDALDSKPGPKNLIIDNELVNSINLILDYQTLKEHKVVSIGNLRQNNSQQILTFYLIKNRSAQTVLSNIDTSVENVLLIVPRIELQTAILLEKNVDITAMEMPLFWSLPENDVMILEIDCFNDLFVRSDPHVLHELSLGCMQLRQIFGIPQRLAGIGKNACLLKNIFSNMIHMENVLESRCSLKNTSYQIPVPQQFPNAKTNNSSGEAEQGNLEMFIFDRNLDLVTPLLKQLTYAGLLSEFCDFNDGHIDGDIPIIDKMKPRPINHKKIKLKDDPLYLELRDMNFAGVGSYLNKFAKNLKQGFDSRNQAQTVPQIKAFVSKLGSLQSEHKYLRLHTNLAEQLQKAMDDDFHKFVEIQQNCVSGIENNLFLDHVEELIARGENVDDTIRLLSIISLSTDGLKSKKLELLKKEFVQTYGIEYFEVWDNLMKCHLISRKEDNIRSFYKTIRKDLNLFVENTPERDPVDISYVLSGIAPLIPRLIQANIDENKNCIKNLNLSKCSTDSNLASVVFDDLLQSESVNLCPNKTFIFVFVGGVTEAECSALRFLFKNTSIKLFICSTSICGPDFFLK
eukprot:NODE_533_length_6371_cov_1.461894.p1 type:complete len:580 gc:universal NODE_533_length_6371_cov_1.461894:3697-1958(-)